MKFSSIVSKVWLGQEKRYIDRWPLLVTLTLEVSTYKWRTRHTV